ncbi:MAG TPA: HAMP domain-containing sensor histidine kinase [Nitrososphaeraceae archaeon]
MRPTTTAAAKWQLRSALDFFSKINNKAFFLVVAAVIFALIIDAMINFVADFVSDRIVSNWGITLFILVAIVCAAGQYFILEFVKHKIKEIRSKSKYLNTMHKVVTVVQYSLTGLMFFVILQILITRQYYLENLIAATAISYLLNVSLLLLFAERLLKWYRSNRNSIVVLLYALSAIAIGFTSTVAMVADWRNLLIKDNNLITPESEVTFPSFDPGTLTTFISDIYNYSDLVSVILMWGSTVLLLHHFSRKLDRLGKVKYWILISLPLIYYLSTFIGFFDLYVAETEAEEFYFYLYISLNSTGAAILFGLAFRTVAKSMRHNSAVRDYMIISAYGFVLLFISNQSTLTPASYPPFGFVTVSFYGLSAYLIFVGLYSAGISMSEDINLRQSIRKSAIEESKLLLNIGAAQMQQQLEKKVIQGAKKHAENMAKQTGIQLSLTEQDMKQYLNTVLKEIKVLHNVDEILKKGKEILDTSSEFLACLRFSGLRLVYNNYFDLYEKIMDRKRKKEHDGIKLVTSIDKDSVGIVRAFLNIGVEIRHVKNLPPIDFSVSDKEMIATIQKTESGEIIQNLLVSNEVAYLDHFVSIFEELWKNGIEAKSRINAIEEGVDSEGIEIIQNPVEIENLGYNLIKSARDEILIIFSIAKSFNPEEGKVRTLALMELLREAVTKRAVKVRIVSPKEDVLEEALTSLVAGLGPVVGNGGTTTTTTTTRQQQEKKEQLPPQQQQLVDIRYIEPELQTKVSVLVVDRKLSLAVELKDNTRRYDSSSYGIIGLATYSNSKATVLSYVSIFETLWKQTEMYEQLKVHDRMQKEFINIAAHELRTPIQPLVLSSESLKGSMPNEERISIVIRNAKKLQTLANEILDITKIESNTLKLNKEKVDINEVILFNVKDILNHQIITEGKVKLVYEPTKENIFVDGDRDRLGQVVSNLLSNSIKFTEQGSISIAVEKSKDGKEVIVSIKDTGCGIDAEILPRLFSKFATKSDVGGTGLGLFICKNIIEAHSGKIWAKNNDEAGSKGATFSFSLQITSPLSSSSSSSLSSGSPSSSSSSVLSRSPSIFSSI